MILTVTLSWHIAGEGRSNVTLNTNKHSFSKLQRTVAGLSVVTWLIIGATTLMSASTHASTQARR